ncbi:MAG: FG-GAP repeat protein [Marinilabiliaceae bacterium]|nr:FG-GAP repeat protein [Marinilabiliaceae bacterium]
MEIIKVKLQGLIIALGFVLLFAISSNGQSLFQFEDFASFDKILKGKIHFSIDSDGKNVAIGDYHRASTDINKNIPQVGCVLIYEKNKDGKWIFTQELKSPRGKAYDNFGVSVALSDKYLVVGALGEDYVNEKGETVYDTGAAYFYTKNTQGKFELVQKICINDLKPYSIFGSKVQIKEDEIIVDSHSEENNNTSWIAHTFKKDENTSEWYPVKEVATDGHIKTKLPNVITTK